MKITFRWVPKDGIGPEICHKWKERDECTPQELVRYNLRFLYPNEVILDIDNPDHAPEVIAKLKEDGLNFSVYTHRGKRPGHIHLYFSDLEKYPIDIRNAVRLVFCQRYGTDEAKAKEETMISEIGRSHHKSHEKKKLLFSINDGHNETIPQWANPEYNDFSRHPRKKYGGEPQTLQEGDIEKVLSKYGITNLQLCGDEYKGSHPIHGSETGHNFSINTLTGQWSCFRHNSGGGLISFVCMMEKTSKCEDFVKW